MGKLWIMLTLFVGRLGPLTLRPGEPGTGFTVELPGGKGVDRMMSRKLHVSMGATHVVFPERDAAHTCGVRIAHPNLLDFIPLPEDHPVIEAAFPARYHGHTLGGLDSRNKSGRFAIGRKREPVRLRNQEKRRRTRSL
jgi:Trk K+ transport system NAD-binding subunit